MGRIGLIFLGLLLANVWAGTVKKGVHTCIHDQVVEALGKKRNIFGVATQQYNASYPTASNTSPIRLLIDTSYLFNDQLGMTCLSIGQVVTAVNSSSGQSIKYSCTSDDILSSSLRSYLVGIIASVQQTWRDTLLVVPVMGNFVLSNNSGNPQGLYGGVYINNTYVNGAQNLDMVIYATARPIVQAGGTTSTLAVATVVQEDQYGRPVLGHLNVNPGGVDLSAAMYPQNFGVVIHETTHALGFTFGKFQNANPDPVTGKKDLTSTVSLSLGANGSPDTRIIISSPRVQAWARNYYGCSTMLGVELENQGGQGTMNSHWEKRVVNNEYMTGTASRNPVFSELTLSLLEDSGWYRANYSTAGSLLWGQGMGCSFVTQRCPNWLGYNGYFCSSNGRQSCTSDIQAKGECMIGEVTGNLDAKYKYFSDPYAAGIYDLPDYCPFTWGYSNGWCFDTSQGSAILNKGEKFGQNSRCFQSSLIKDLPVGGSSGATCYEAFCTGPNELRVKVDDYWYLCPPGSSIKAIGYGGTISCPAQLSQVCPSSANDTTWPVFYTVSPNAGGPKLSVTITGKNFIKGMSVSIGDPLEDIQVLSPSLVTATIPNSQRFKNPANILDQKVSVILTDAKGRTVVGYNAFTIKVVLNKQFFENALDYLASNWLITAALVAAIVVTCLICGYCCYRQKGKAEEADTEYYD